MPGPPDVVVLSPHLDDAVLSLGALIARQARCGRRVEVWTAFTRAPDLSRFPRSWRPFGDYATRLAEDDEALALLGATGHRLDLPERVWRDPRPRTLAGAFRRPATVEGFGYLDAVTEAIGEALAHRDVEVYAPLGIGGHADHVEVAVAAIRAGLACGDLPRIRFYEDFYALGERFRRQHPVSRLRPDPPLRSPGVAAPGLGAALWCLALTSSGPRLDEYAPGIRAVRWLCEPQPVGGDETAKLAAVSAYRSQVPRLGGRPRLERALRRAHQVRGGEVVWRAQPPPAPGRG